MSGTKILWGQILVVGLLALAGVWLATEWTAWRLGFQPQLGPPWFRLGGWPVYPPPAFFVWWFIYEAYAPDVFARGAFMAAGGALVAVAVAIGMSIWRAREAKKVTTYGSARWATAEEARAAGLLGSDGVVLGRLTGDR
ncbi:MAG TPA: conjugal transfer protein TraG, partial [Caulobacter sp.]|nr:conjugal transfer protein TraG [Caulobacter sp.]